MPVFISLSAVRAEIHLQRRNYMLRNLVIPDEAKRKSGIFVLIGVLTNNINNTPF